MFLIIFYYSRDYTNPYLPVAPSAIDGTGQVNVSVSSFKFDCMVPSDSPKLLSDLSPSMPPPACRA